MIKNIIFDFDGVIVDSEILASRAFAKYLNNQGYTINEENFYTYAGMKTVQVIDILSEKYNIDDKEKFSLDIFEIVSKIYSNDLKLVDGVSNFILNSKRNHFIGSNSNKDRIINGLNIVGLFADFSKDKIYSFDMVKNPKPDPDVYLKVISENNLLLNETIVIEDSIIGVKAGISAGLKVFGITAGKHWHSNRDKNELYKSGAVNVFSDYKSLGKAIEEI
tara:strand:+ start:911 stop:1570 length:660 start_codon:yes stop_codon:yes gene_type:complete